MARKNLIGISSSFLQFMVLVLTMSLAGMVSAFTPEKSAEKTAEESIVVILELIRGLNSQSSTDQYLEEMEGLMDELISYTVIARRVMGEYFAGASREQKIKFLSALKTSLINTYALGIRSFGGYKVAVQYGKGDQKTLKNTQVYLEIQSPEGNRYPMMQSMYYSRKANGWLVQNIVFNGVNIGITFKNQFERVMTAADGNIEQATLLWIKNTQESYEKANYRDPSESLINESNDGGKF